MTPEERARVKIDEMLESAGWLVVDRDSFDASVQAVAVREGLLKHGLEADYLLYLNGVVIGVVEAKRAETDPGSEEVRQQAENYCVSVPKTYPTISKRLPIVYLSNGERLLYRNLDTMDDYEQRGAFHKPHRLCEMLGIGDIFAGLPVLKSRGLRECQYKAILNFEQSLRDGYRRALLVLATGAGKTYTACTAAYRLLAYTKMRRVLFLVDRTNLGKQAEGEFFNYKLTETGDNFSNIYTVNRLRSNDIDTEGTNVMISTIQRLFALLTGQEIDDDEREGENEEMVESAVVVPEQTSLPHDYFDLIIVDECHRSIYGNWKSVLEYFDTARILGLTATPGPETLAFFNNNQIYEYTLEQSILDGVNVDARIYRIKTKQSEEGGQIGKGDRFTLVTNYTGESENKVLRDEPQQYGKNQLNRDIVNPAQIRLILQTYREAVYRDMYPDREPEIKHLPKTLIYALNERHASNIEQIAKEVFPEIAENGIKKITYSAGDSNALIKEFRTSKEFRIAITCTLVATGTDIKPLEVVMFMRDVQSEQLYIQMKGRGVRTVDDLILRDVTPNAVSKDGFFIVDAVGVTEHEKRVRGLIGIVDKEPSLKEILEKISIGYIPDRYIHRLACIMARIDKKAEAEKKADFQEMTALTIREMAERLFNALEGETLPPFVDVNEPNKERKEVVKPLAENPRARKLLLILNAGFLKILNPGEDELIVTGFSVEEARATTEAFERYCQEHRDDLEALRIIYNSESKAITYAMLEELKSQMEATNVHFRAAELWNSYRVIKPEAVAIHRDKAEREALTNLIQLVRYAYRMIERLEGLYPKAQSYFNLWYGRLQQSLTQPQIEVMRQVIDFVAANGAVTVANIKEAKGMTEAARFVQAYGNKERANEYLEQFAKFIQRAM